jgi:hypothetical protein
MPTRNDRERAARALCSKDGYPENITFEGKPMWQSYLDVVDTVIAALGDGNALADTVRVPRMRLGRQK